MTNYCELGEMALWAPVVLQPIGEAAFWNCPSIEAVFIPRTVTHIDDEAFQYCTSLRFLYAPKEIEHFGDAAFQGCGRLLTTVKYKFGDEAFQ